MESIAAMDEGDMVIKQWVWLILECAPCRRKRCLICNGRGAMLTDLQISSNCCMVQRRWASKQREVVRVLSRYPPPGRGSPYDREPIWWPPIERDVNEK